jgi:hypothetical protein
LEKLRARKCEVSRRHIRDYFMSNIISRFQRWEGSTGSNLGRWRRLLHFAPLALPDLPHGRYALSLSTLIIDLLPHLA